MSLETDVMEQLKTAMKEKNQGALRSFRAIKAAILEFKTSAHGHSDLSAEDEISILQKMVKQRRDSVSIYKQQGREDLAKTEEEELAVIETFLPKQLSAEELDSRIKAIIEKTGAGSIKDMGKVMGIANKELKGTAEGAAIAAAVKKNLGA